MNQWHQYEQFETFEQTAHLNQLHVQCKDTRDLSAAKYDSIAELCY